MAFLEKRWPHKCILKLTDLYSGHNKCVYLSTKLSLLRQTIMNNTWLESVWGLNFRWKKYQLHCCKKFLAIILHEWKVLFSKGSLLLEKTVLKTIWKITTFFFLEIQIECKNNIRQFLPSYDEWLIYFGIFKMHQWSNCKKKMRV